ncbi:MAG TPA: hypothetical protein PK414_00980 [Anaerolineales bacterium]|nr:hypothetical protein [Anaerolineales bacterium]HNB34764.1 hypothetical protein [Anaerolineales bacterium]HNC08675.1 hypothetical protein [Anaerolineales bacterium]
MKTKLFLSKLTGILSTAMLITASIAPNTLNIPMSFRPWIFMGAVAWTLLIVSGVFSS